MVRPSKNSKSPELESDCRIALGFALRVVSRSYTGSLDSAENLTNRTCHSMGSHGSNRFPGDGWMTGKPEVIIGLAFMGRSRVAGTNHDTRRKLMIAAFFRPGSRVANLLTLIVVMIVWGAAFSQRRRSRVTCD